MTANAARTQTSRARAGLGLAVSFVVCFAAAGLGGLFTARSVGTWYQALERPSFNPPDWLFGPVWTLLYAMMALAAWNVWRQGGPLRKPMAAFAVQLALNTLWSLLFFGLRQPGAALVEIVFLSVAIWLTIALFWKRSRLSAALLVPYALWVAFATALNAAIWHLNQGT